MAFGLLEGKKTLTKPFRFKRKWEAGVVLLKVLALTDNP